MKRLFAVLVLLVSGCAATGPMYETPPLPPEGFATLIFYRMPTGYGGAYAVELQIDDREKVASVNEKGYTVVLLRSRERPYLIGLTNAYRGIPVPVRAGETYFVRYAASPPALSLYGGVVVANDPAYPINLVSTDEALQQIKKYEHKLQPAAVTQIE